METSETEYEQNSERERIANNFIVSLTLKKPSKNYTFLF